MVDRFTGARAAIEQAAPSWVGEKWVAPESLHVTLKFLGDLTAEDVDDFSLGFRAAITNVEPGAILWTGLTAKPRPAHANMVWATALDPDGIAVRLARSADRAAAEVGVKPESRPFTPHATLARARTPRPIAAETLLGAWVASGDATSQTMSVPAVTVFESRLSTAGPTYHRLDRFVLGQS